MHEIPGGSLCTAELPALAGCSGSVWNVHAPLENWDPHEWGSSRHHANIATLFDGTVAAEATGEEKSASWPLVDLSDTAFKQMALMTRAPLPRA